MTETPMTASARRRRWLRALLWSGGSAFAAATVYLVAMTFLWGLNVADLRSAIDDLSVELDASTAILEDTTARLEASQSELDAILDSVVDLANVKAQAQDYQLFFFDLAGYMSDCADQAGELVGYVYNRDRYTARSLLRSEEYVIAYYQEISAAFDEIVGEMEQDR